jgi:hypothetical protein
VCSNAVPFADGEITYSEATALVVQARARIANDPAAYRDFAASEAGKAWTGGVKSFASTGDAGAVRFAVVQLLKSVGFDGAAAYKQGEAIAKLWRENVNAGPAAQRWARYGTGGLEVRGPPGAPSPSKAAGVATPLVASAATVTLTGSIEGQQAIKATFEGGITGEKARVLVVRARIYAGQPTASTTPQVRDALIRYLEAHGFLAATAGQLGEMIEAAWRTHDQTGAATLVDVSAVTGVDGIARFDVEEGEGYDLKVHHGAFRPTYKGEGDYWLTEIVEATPADKRGRFKMLPGATVVWGVTFSAAESNFDVLMVPAMTILPRSAWGARAPITGDAKRSYEPYTVPLESILDSIVVHHSGNDNHHTMKEVQDVSPRGTSTETTR